MTVLPLKLILYLLVTFYLYFEFLYSRILFKYKYYIPVYDVYMKQYNNKYIYNNKYLVVIIKQKSYNCVYSNVIYNNLPLLMMTNKY